METHSQKSRITLEKGENELFRILIGQGKFPFLEWFEKSVNSQ
jgi:hypothetical protein